MRRSLLSIPRPPGWAVFGVLTLAALLMPLAGPAAAQGSEARAGELIGREVMGPRGEHVGELSDLIFDSQDGTLRAAIVKYGGLFGLGEREVALPAGALARRGEHMAVRAGEAALRDAPAFERAKWPAMRATALIHREVRDRLHRDAGEIVDLVVDLAGGRVRYAIVETRDDWRAGSRRVPVPIDSFSLPRDIGDLATLNVTRENMGAAPEN